MLGEEVFLFGLLGMLTSATIGVFMTEFKEPKLAMLLAFQGAFTGWLAGMIWIFLTGGLEITLFALVLPIFISGFFSFIILQYTPPQVRPSKPVGKVTTRVATFALFALCFAVAFSSVPVVFDTVFNTQAVPVDQLDLELGWSQDEVVITDVGAQATYSMPMTIECSQSSVTFGTMAELPSKNTYYDFKVFLKSDAVWEQPYLKIGIYKDTDENGVLSKGDVLWSDTQYKISTENSLWRANCIWENHVPKYGAFSTEGKLLPIFHAKTISEWSDETEARFMNTPEGFKPQQDMISWEALGDKILLKEQPMEYASISPGDVSKIQGKVYCSPASVGKHIIIIEAYDAQNIDFMTAYTEEGEMIQQKVIPFSVTTLSEEATFLGIPNLGAVILLGILTIVAILYSRKEGLLR